MVSSPWSTDAIPEGSQNLYFTEARAKGAVQSDLNAKADLVGGKVPASQLPEVSQIDEKWLVHKEWEEPITWTKIFRALTKMEEWLEFMNKKGIKREANTDFAQIVFNSNNNDDTTLDFKLGDDGSEFFRFMFNNIWYFALNNTFASFKQKFFANAQVGEFPDISLAIWDSDTGFNWNGDGNFTMKANGVDLNHFYNGRAPLVRQGMNNGEIKTLSQSEYDALGNGRPSNTIYFTTE